MCEQTSSHEDVDPELQLLLFLCKINLWLIIPHTPVVLVVCLTVTTVIKQGKFEVDELAILICDYAGELRLLECLSVKSTSKPAITVTS